MDASNSTPAGGPCAHARTRLIAKDKDAEYIECLDCGEILEGEERKEPREFNESLSDA
jgi:ribosomal protein L34E